jgi:hypothetical protein
MGSGLVRESRSTLSKVTTLALDRLHFDLHAITVLAAMTMTSLKQRPGLFRGLRFNAPLFCARDQYGGVERPELRLLFERCDSHLRTS